MHFPLKKRLQSHGVTLKLNKYEMAHSHCYKKIYDDYTVKVDVFTTNIFSFVSIGHVDYLRM